MNGIKLSDAHTHIGSEQELSMRCDSKILSLVCASEPSEAEMLLSRPHSCIIPTAGIHPWHAGDLSLDEMVKWLSAFPVIGEIGMDSVWCNTPLPIQRKIFCSQLELAAQQKKPVILHTKGQEKEIASIIREYPGRYLVHWYSCSDYLEKYLDLDCYFSIGPDVWWNPAVRAVAKKAPLNRILIETDGMSAVKWAYEEAPDMPDSVRIPETPADSLYETLLTIAKIRHLSPKDAGLLFYRNLNDGFLAAL